VEYDPRAMLITADTALDQTLALLVTFIGIGVVVNLLILYIVVQVLGERRQNRERRQNGI
jgi:energy-converting hydrogenase Eha subunit E